MPARPSSTIGVKSNTLYIMLVMLLSSQAQQDPIIQLRPGDRARNVLAGKGSIGDRPQALGAATEQAPSALDRPIRPPSRPSSSQSNLSAPGASLFGSPPSRSQPGTGESQNACVSSKHATHAPACAGILKVLRLFR